MLLYSSGAKDLLWTKTSVSYEMTENSQKTGTANVSQEVEGRAMRAVLSAVQVIKGLYCSAGKNVGSVV